MYACQSHCSEQWLQKQKHHVKVIYVKDIRMKLFLLYLLLMTARAKVVAAEGEQKASVALKNAAEIINKSPIALQLRYLQTLTTIASEKNSTIVFPIAIDYLNTF